jgi:predicted Rossmann fold nucleotide-binding protein DprA/Smf involved in DNA uptake
MRAAITATPQQGLAWLSRGDSSYPAALIQYLGQEAPATLTARGNMAIIQQKKLALFCSIRCPGKLILETYDLAHTLRDAGITVIGGFHSPMERECLRVLLRGRQPIIVCPARGIEKIRLPADWQVALAAGRLLILSPFGAPLRRATAELARERNYFVAALADEVFIAYAAPGGKAEAFAREVVDRGKRLFTLDDPANANLLALGARPAQPRSIPG